MKLSDATIDILQKQLLNELIAFYTYMDLACWCDAHSYPGAAHWLKVQCQEEMLHVWKIQQFLVDSGVEVKLSDIPAPRHTPNSLRDVFELAKKHEEGVSQNYYEIMDVIQRERDFAAMPLIQWFLTEQVEEEKNVQDVIDQIVRMEKDPAAMMQLDKELGTRPLPAPVQGTGA